LAHAEPTSCIVIHVAPRRTRGDGRDPQARLDEALGLARVIGLRIVHSEIVRYAALRPSTLLGEGAVERIKGIVAASEAALVYLDHAVSPVQQRNLERAWNCKVVDRTGLILEIFGARARTAEGRLQVELASLMYQRSRLVRTWTHLERQRGGFGFLAGPGETQLEVDRRLLGDRIEKLQADLEKVRRTRALHRRARARVPYPVVALVGYTNAGKSTLFNRLVAGDVVAADMLFATLDPTVRRLVLPSGRSVVVSDTVGFISDLPTDLVAAFRATLEEVTAADLVLHVRDVAHADTEAQREDVLAVLAQLGIEPGKTKPVIEILNKLDLLGAPARAALLNGARRSDDTVAVSALTGEGIERLFGVLDRRLAADDRVVETVIPHEDGQTLAWLHQHGEVLEQVAGDDGVRVKVSLDPVQRQRFLARRRQGIEKQ
jgi:GTP-binding protein HflX